MLKQPTSLHVCWTHHLTQKTHHQHLLRTSSACVHRSSPHLRLSCCPLPQSSHQSTPTRWCGGGRIIGVNLAPKQAHCHSVVLQRQAYITCSRYQAQEDMGLPTSTEDPKTTKNQQLLLAYRGPHHDAADEALSKLFAMQTKAA
jgi:hypothetical protein